MHTEQNTEYKIQDTENRTTKNNTENKQRTNTPEQNSAHNYRTYSLDFYHEYAYIKDSNTIELYTISKD